MNTRSHCHQEHHYLTTHSHSHNNQSLVHCIHGFHIFQTCQSLGTDHWSINTVLIILSYPFTPSYKKTILESKQPVSGIDFFFRFSPRLSENDYSRVKFIAKFVPTASNLRYFGLNCCVFPVKSVVHAHHQLAHDT